jgi:hypothetical protein
MRHLALAIALLVPFQAMAATLRLDLQPVHVCTPAGCPPSDYSRYYFDRVMAPAGIQVRHLRPTASPPLALPRDAAGALDPVGALMGFARWQLAAGTQPGTAYVGFAGPLSGSTLGIAFRNAPGFASLPFGLTEPQANRRLTAAIVAHEIGHVLGAPHVESDTLMGRTLAPWLFEDRRYLPPLNPATVLAMRSSPILRATGDPAGSLTASVYIAPVPGLPAGAALLTALALLARLRRRASPA